MTPEELAGLVSDLSSAAEVVEAIDDPQLRRQRGWDLAGWQYELVPWGVRFSRDGPRPGDVFVLAGPHGETLLPAGGGRHPGVCVVVSGA